MNQRIIGWNNFHRLLSNLQSTLARAPLVLVRSKNHASKELKNIGEICFNVQMKHNLNTIFSDIAMGSMPNKTIDVHKLVELMHRVGAKTVVGVGDTGAMNLARAAALVASSKSNNADNSNSNKLILVPTAYEAVLFANTKSALVFDDEEHYFVVPDEKDTADDQRTIVHLPEQSFDNDGGGDDDLSNKKQQAIQAGLAVVLDHIIIMLEQTVDDSLTNTGNTTAGVLDILRNEPSHEEITNFLHDAGAAVSFGDNHHGDGRRRSIALAVVAALLPTCFPPESTISSIMASLVPNLAKSLGVCNLPDVFPKQIAQSSTNSDDLVKHIRANARLWNCVDADEKLIRQILEDHALL